MMNTRQRLIAVPASDLFVLLERNFRRRARGCERCAFTLPYRVFANGEGGPNWSIATAAKCTEACRLVLEQVVAEHQAMYELA